MRALQNTIILIILVSIATFSCKSDPFKVPEYLLGNWSYTGKLSVRDRKDGKFIFIEAKEEITLQISIAADGTVTGTIGTAVFENCVLASNRNSLQRFLNLGTDFIITGKIKGKIFPEDPFSEMEISFPLNYENDRIKGAIFQFPSKGMFPIMSFISATKMK